MANTHIPVGPNADRLGNRLRQEVDRAWALSEGIQQLKLIMDEAAAPPDWTGVEALLGLDPGQGETVYNLLAGTNTALQSSDVQQFIRRLG